MEEARIEKSGDLLEEFEELKKIINKNSDERENTRTYACNHFLTLICC